MGDLWHGNILIDTHQHPHRLYILDWELTRTGLPGSEIGLFCANVNLLRRENQVACGPASVMLQNFLDAYYRISNQDARLAQETLAHWGIFNAFWAPRDPPLAGDRELVHELVREGVQFTVQSRDKDYLALSPVNGLLPK
jgi:5-methylthioribose kinase